MSKKTKTKKDYTKDIVEYPQEQPEVEDSLSVYRDMFTKTEDERLEEEDQDTQTIKNITNLNITKKTDDWTDNPNNLKFAVGDLVVYNKKGSETIYKMVGYHRDFDTYMVKPSLSEHSHPKRGCELKEAPEGSKWEPLILDPYKKWKMEQEKKNGK
jgi:hypothetical protein